MLAPAPALVSPFASLPLPLPLCPYSAPCLALTPASLVAASTGSNTLHRITVWKHHTCTNNL